MTHPAPETAVAPQTPENEASGDVGFASDSSVEDVFRIGLTRGTRNQRPKAVALPATA